jgi:pimeloyl-ACP methyl ester carboxylesterase
MGSCRSIFRAVLAAASLGLNGCVGYAPDDGTAAAIATTPLADWPERSTEHLEQIIQRAPDVLSVRVKYDIVVDGRVVHEPKRLVSSDTQYSGLYGRGILRFYRAQHGEPTPISTGLCFFSGADAQALENPESNLHGTWLRIDQPSTGLPARGLIIHLTSLGGYDYERPVLEELRSRGWAILWVDSSTVRPTPIGFGIDPDHPEPAAEAIAQHVSDRVSEIAYAVEAGLDFISRERPEIPTTPLVLCGYSAGALAAPTVAALIPRKIDAAVLVGGGANLLDISQRSALTDGGIKLYWPSGSASRADRRRLNALYLEHCRLDPYWTASALRDKPILLLHAVFDRIVPASDGDLLYKRLDRPERINFPLGHELLFLHLPTQAKTIADWIDSKEP